MEKREKQCESEGESKKCKREEKVAGGKCGKSLRTLENSDMSEKIMKTNYRGASCWRRRRRRTRRWCLWRYLLARKRSA